MGGLLALVGAGAGCTLVTGAGADSGAGAWAGAGACTPIVTTPGAAELGSP